MSIRYTAVGSSLGRLFVATTERSVRAVAGPCAANPVVVAIPCHRVVSASGDLGGYRWGVKRKKALLSSEAENLRARP